MLVLVRNMVELNWPGYDICNDAYLKSIAVAPRIQCLSTVLGIGKAGARD